MIDAIKKIRDFVVELHPAGSLPYRIEDIRQAVLHVTGIELIEFVEFDDPDNPIIGRYERYEMQPAPYADRATKVSIFHSKSCNFCWTRYVLCKEMAQALEDEPSLRVKSSEQLRRLAESLRVDPETKEALGFFAPFASEKAAEFIALELLCPLEDRKKIAQVRGQYSDKAIADAFRIPVDHVSTIFDPRYIQATEAVLLITEKALEGGLIGEAAQ